MTNAPYKNTGTKSQAMRRAPRLKINYRTIRSYKQYSYMPDPDRQAMWEWWCVKNSDSVDREGSMNDFVAWLDSLLTAPDLDEADLVVDLDAEDDKLPV